MPSINKFCSVFLLLLSTGNKHAVAQRHLRGPTNDVNSDDIRLTATTAHLQQTNPPSVMCRLTVVDTMYPKDHEPQQQQHDDDDDDDRDNDIHCIPIIGDRPSQFLYPIKLPKPFYQQHFDHIHTGTMLVNVTHAVITDNEIQVADQAHFDAIVDVPDHLRHLVETTFTTGQKTLAVIRLSTQDASPMYSASELATYITQGSVNMIDQFSQCSFGQLDYVLSDTGFMDFSLDNKVTDFATPELLVQEAQKQLSSRYMEPDQIADTVIFCLPPGTGNWLAKAPLNHWRAMFNDEWCVSLTCLMHEIGHLMGLRHSGRDGNPYMDTTGYMSWGLRSPTFPRKCYNGEKSWDLGWYKDRHLLLSPANDGPAHFQLAAFTDYPDAAQDEPVVVSIDDDIFLLYNRMESFNDQTEEKQDQVTVTKRLSDRSDSLAGLSEGQRYTVDNYKGTGKTLIIEACKRTDRPQGQADIVEISVALDKSMCGTQLPSTTQQVAATPVPAELATPAPSGVPMAVTPAPTDRPTAAPTIKNAVATQVSPPPAASPTQQPDEQCSGNLIDNADMESGYDGYWIADGRGSISDQPNYMSGNALHNTNRLRTTDGLVYRTKDHFDNDCLEPGATYLFNFDVQLIDKTTGLPASCDPLSDCPQVRLVLWQWDRQLVLVETIRGYNLSGNEWKATQFNQFFKEFTFPTNWDGTVRQFQLSIRDFPTRWDMIVDNFSMRRLS